MSEKTEYERGSRTCMKKLKISKKESEKAEQKGGR